jgi:hypothetical protein
VNAKSTESQSAARERTGFELVSPKDVLGREDLSRDEKLELLHQWELDLREHMVAEEENMLATEPVAVTLDEVLDALRALGAESRFQDVTTKHG